MSKSTERKKIRQFIQSLDFEGPLKVVIQQLQDILAHYGPSTYIVEEYDYDGNSSYNVFYDRQETDKEYEARLKKLAAVRAKNVERNKKKLEKAKKEVEESEARERELYEKLKQKFVSSS